MDTLLKTPNKLEFFVSQFHGFERLGTTNANPSRVRLGVKKRAIKIGSGAALLDLVPETKKENLDSVLPLYDTSMSKVVDLAIVGGGPAGLAVAQQVSEAGLSVCSIDPSPKLIWPNNYGVWVDEFEAMDLLDCLDTTWSGAVVYIDEGVKKDLNRPYGRVNRKQLKSKMLKKCITNGVKFHQSKVTNVSTRSQTPPWFAAAVSRFRLRWFLMPPGFHDAWFSMTNRTTRGTKWLMGL